MTSAAFLLGVVPLVFSTGGGSESRHSIGTGVFGGVISATVLGLVFTPVAFYLVMRATARFAKPAGGRGSPGAGHPGAGHPAAGGRPARDPETEAS